MSCPVLRSQFSTAQHLDLFRFWTAPALRTWSHFCRLLWPFHPPLSAHGSYSLCDGLMVAERIPESSLKPVGSYYSYLVFSFPTWSMWLSPEYLQLIEAWKLGNVWMSLFFNCSSVEPHRALQPKFTLSIDCALYTHAHPKQEECFYDPEFEPENGTVS